MRRFTAFIPRSLTMATLLLAMIPGEMAASPADPPPNFVIVFADDLGYNDVGCFGSPLIRTPRLDRMAQQGLRLTSFYAQTYCGPSRAALMTGCYPMRVAERGNVKHVHAVLHEREVTLAEVLRARGYATAMIGKWDLAGHSNTAYRPELLPGHQGFDTHFGTPSSNDSDRDTILLRDGRVIEHPADQATLTRRYTDEAIGFIKAHRSRPFFVYLAHNMPHMALHASPPFVGKSRRGLYGDVVEEIDFNVGRILDALVELGLDRNTYVLFTSDNGPWLRWKEKGGSADPLRSGKTSSWEGGPRVPCIVWGPGRVPAGGVSDTITTTMDVMPTFAALAGTQPPTDRVIDGRDIRDILHGQPREDRAPRVFYYYVWTHLQAVREGRWKLWLRKPAKPPWLGVLGDGSHIDPADEFEVAEPMLFDLEADIGERNDVAQEHPEVVERLLALADDARNDIGDYDRIGRNMRFFDPETPRPQRPEQERVPWLKWPR